VLRPRYAVAWAAFFNFAAFLIFGLHVANTIGKGIIDITIVDKTVIFATLIGACGWNVITWYFGLPTSSSHALIGGMIGAALVKVGVSALVWQGIVKTLLFIFLSPALGLIFGLLFGILVYGAFHKSAPMKVDHVFRKGQLFSAALYSLEHGRRRPEDDGHHLQPPFQRGASGHGVPRAVVERAGLPRRDSAGHHVRRLAHREDDGAEGCEAAVDGFCARPGP
jgi:hypothetical protein